MLVKSRSIVLHRFAYSDSSWIVKVLTEECGIISFIIKGGKRKESPFKGALDPLALNEVVFRQNGKSELLFVKEASIINWHKNLRENLLHQAKAQVMAEMILRYAPQGIPLDGEFKLLKEAYAELDSETENSTNANGTFSRWLLNICDLWGYNLDIGSCARCEKKLNSPAKEFFPETGNLICKECFGSEIPRAKEETLEGLWALYNGNNPNDPQFTENAILTYLKTHIGFLKEIHSIQWLQEIRKLCSPQTT